ncbi:MAG TPA: GNAT family N-acetyltransferase [Acholeplasmataceae bacterium]|nr:GNAT family N-acetyltransferase [Acholeplasmataceae bacterium]
MLCWIFSIRIDKEVVWGESFYILDHYQKKGIRSLLINKAEEFAKSFITLYHLILMFGVMKKKS